ncbi:MAG TPA: M23 family metallopeptidase, partial [Polyangiaceae bacterium]|nr:M23 family metallopeptidase [Polyangiaceae bacterium]
FQQGNAEVVFVGILFGKTVATRHTLLESGKNRDYLLIYGHLDQTATGLAPGAEAAAGTWLGTVGDSGSEGRVHLFLEVRQVRENTEHSLLLSSALVDFTVSIACDPRNVLPFADSPASPAPP